MFIFSIFIDTYPAYVDDFENLERMAPNVDLPPLKILTLHEVVAIEFAEMEIAGNDGGSGSTLQ